MGIERKFLLKEYPYDISDFDYMDIEQGYLSTNPEIRIRKCKTLGVIFYYKLDREENEAKISKREYNNYMKDIHKTIKKKRYYIPLEKLKIAEIDVYDNINDLTIVKVNFLSKQEAKEFIPPNWFGKEITYNEEYKDKNLIKLVNDKKIIGNEKLNISNDNKTTLLNIRGEVVKIDSRCVPLVVYFNNIGLDTKYCCEGHSCDEPYYIMFEDYITDEQIFKFINQFSTQYDHTPFLGSFNKWCRKMSGKITLNWMYTVNTKERADIDYLRMNSDEFKVENQQN